MFHRQLIINDHFRTLSYYSCDLEIKAVLLASVSMNFSMLFLYTIAVPLFPNKFWLPMNFKITFIPFNEIFDIYWILNYLYQMIFPSICMVFYIAYVPMIMIVMNHSCWILDSIRFKVIELGNGLEMHSNISDIDTRLNEISVLFANYIF